MRFTVGIPAYKSKYLKECIDSIINQTYRDFEIVILNDASPENINAIIEGYSLDNFRYYKNETNFGAVNVVDNWNKCLSYATGDYFILMGDDDKMCPNYLAEFNKLIEKYPLCGVYHCRSYIIDEESSPITLSEPRPEFESVYDSIYQRMMGSRLFFISDYVFKTGKLRSNGGFYKLPLAWASDDISSFIAAEENGIAHTNTPVFMYRRNSQTISTTGNVYLKMDAIIEEEMWLNSFTKKIPENSVDMIILNGIKLECKKFILKKKIRTIYTSLQGNSFSFLKWFFVKRKYQLSTLELMYAFLLSFKEKRKKRYG